MSIATALTALQADISAARTAITTKGGTVTSGGGSSQLATDIATIPTSSTVTHTVKWVDFNGTVLKQETVNDGGSSSAPSTNPSHTRLVFDGWEKGTTLTNITEDEWNLAYYHVDTADANKVFLNVDVPANSNLIVFATLNLNSDITFDWGDGTTETITISTRLIPTPFNHIYTTAFIGTVTISSAAVITYGAGGSNTPYGRSEYIEEVLLGNSVSFSGPCSGGASGGQSERVCMWTSGVKGLVLPQSCTSLGSYIIQNSGVKYLHIPRTVTSLVKDSLENCASLEYIYIPSTVTILKDNVFRYDIGLKKIEFEDKTTVTEIGGYAFGATSSLETFDVNFPNLSTIGTYAFASSSITKVTNLGNITTLPMDSFSQCKSLTEANISGITIINNEAFYECNSLQTVTLSSALTSIGQKAFLNCYALELNSLPTTITTLMAGAFYGCSSLSIEVNLPNLTSMPSLNNYGAFQNTAITKVISLGNTITSIPHQAFHNCKSLTSVVLPSPCSLELGSFQGTYSLDTINIPLNASSQPNNLTGFRYSGIKYADLTNVGNIPAYGFDTVSRLETVYFGINVGLVNKSWESCSYTLKSIDCASGWVPGYALRLNNANLERDVVVQFFNHLGNGTVTITLSSYTKSKLSDADKAIATAKGYTIS